MSVENKTVIHYRGIKMEKKEFYFLSSDKKTNIHAVETGYFRKIADQ